jgi:hypothetical protein
VRLRFAANKTLWLGVLAFALCAQAKDSKWWQTEVFKLTDSAYTLQEQARSLLRVKGELYKHSANPDQNAVGVIDLMSNFNSDLAKRVHALATTMDMAGFSSQEDRPEVVYRIRFQCLELHLETVEKLEPLRDRLTSDAPHLSNQIDAVIKAHDQAAVYAAKVCESIKQ